MADNITVPLSALSSSTVTAPVAALSQDQPSSSISLSIKGAAEAEPAIAHAAYAFATSPTAKAAASALARKIAPAATLMSGAASGAALGGVPGAISGAILAGPAAAKSAWPAGRMAWQTMRMLQGFTTPVASALEKLAPYAEAIASSPVLAAQNGLDLAQTLEPNRRDIGIMGIGSSVKPSALSPNEQAATISSIHGLLEKGVPMGHPVIQGLLMKLPQDVIQAIGHEAQAQKAQAQP